MPDPEEDSGHSRAKTDTGPQAPKEEVSFVAHPPAPPKLDVVLPEHPSERKAAKAISEGYAKSAMASSAVMSFVMPIVTLCGGGFWLDEKMKHTTPYLSMVGLVVGLITGVSSLLKTLNRMSK